MTKEEWKNVPVIHGRSFSKYEASSLGQIRNKKSRYILSTKSIRSCYISNDLCDDEGNSKTMSFHIVVARTFLGEPSSVDLTIDHINRDKLDNRIVNLRWATKQQQMANSDRSNCGAKGQPVIQYSMNMEEIKKWTNIITAANELGINSSNIGQACRGKVRQAGGFKWSYERQNLPGEIWKKHKSINVQVSNMGRIKSPHSHITYGSKSGDGCYLMYGTPAKPVHVIIAESFLSNPGNKPEVNHKDKIGTNNKVENLEWVTSSENKIHSNQTNSNPNRYSTAKAVKQYDLEENFICEYRSTNEAAKRTGCSQPTISRVCLGLSESTKGFVFRYSNKNLINQPVFRYPNKVDFIDKNGNVIDTYESARAAAVDLGISDKSIYKILCGITKETKSGYRFKYH